MAAAGPLAPWGDRELIPGKRHRSDDALLDTLETWLLPHLHGVRSAADWKAFDLLPALRAMLDWDQMQALDRAAPGSFTTPLGRDIALGLGKAQQQHILAGGTHLWQKHVVPPEGALRQLADAPLQEMFGVTTHPVVAGRPLRVTLLSPAQRPVQTTMDLPGFWATSYADVRKDMRGRYPKHPWPEDPTVADPTLRTKRKG